MNISDLLVIGDVYIIEEHGKIDSDRSRSNELPKAVEKLTKFKENLRNEVKRTVQPPGVIKRPTAGELLAKDEPQEKKDADNALKETLDQIPELQKAKEYLEQQKK